MRFFSIVCRRFTHSKLRKSLNLVRKRQRTKPTIISDDSDDDFQSSISENSSTKSPNEKKGKLKDNTVCENCNNNNYLLMSFYWVWDVRICKQKFVYYFFDWDTTCLLTFWQNWKINKQNKVSYDRNANKRSPCDSNGINGFVLYSFRFKKKLIFHFGSKSGT